WRLDPLRFAVRRPGRHYSSAGKPHGAQLQLSISEAATVRVAFTQLVPGHRHGHACRAKGHGKRCTLSVRLGHLDYHLAAGPHAIAISGLLHGRTLKPGAYVLSVVAVNAEGQSSAGVSQRFRVLR